MTFFFFNEYTWDLILFSTTSVIWVHTRGSQQVGVFNVDGIYLHYRSITVCHCRAYTIFAKNIQGRFSNMSACLITFPLELSNNKYQGIFILPPTWWKYFFEILNFPLHNLQHPLFVTNLPEFVIQSKDSHCKSLSTNWDEQFVGFLMHNIQCIPWSAIGRIDHQFCMIHPPYPLYRQATYHHEATVSGSALSN